MNMMDPQLKRLGIGSVTVSGSPHEDYWTLNLGSDGGQPDQSCLSGQPSGACEDKDANCATSYEQFCFDDRIKKTCPKTCRACSSQPPPAGSCEDKDPNCATSYKQYCFDDRIKKTCAKTCNAC